MVEFCTVCGTSLPKGDLSFKGGKMFTSHDYPCPSCGKIANPGHSHENDAAPEPSPERDIVFKKGQVSQS
jgi:hypothetical protein